MKKFLSLFVVLILIAGLAGCGGESPEQAVTNAFDAIKNIDGETASKYFNYDELLNAGETGEEATDAESDAESKEMAELILKHFDYKIVSSSKDGDSATVKAEITNVDMKSVLANFISQAFILAFSGLDEATMDQQMNDKFKELINSEDNKTVTETVDINLVKKEDGWKIDMSDDLEDSIFGGMISAAEDMGNLFGGDSDIE